MGRLSGLLSHDARSRLNAHGTRDRRGGGALVLREDAVSGAAQQPRSTPRSLQKPGSPTCALPLDVADRAATGKPGDPRCRLRYVAGGEVRPSRAGCPRHRHRYQRHEPALHARASAESINSRISSFTSCRLRTSRDLGRTFDHVVCTGVLHHLPDPDDGLRALRHVLRPRGAMHLMVYALYGRTGIYMMQEYCRLLGVTGSGADLRDLGELLHKLPASHPSPA